MAMIVRALLAHILLDPRTKSAVFAALHSAAQKTDNKLDDQTVGVIETVWDAVIPAIVAKK
jgi:hypothetical protein